MKCPYCAEEILDEAVVCKHCRRDLSLFGQILRRVEDEAKRLDAVDERLSAIESPPHVPAQAEEEWVLPLAWHCVFAAVIAAATSTMAYEVWSLSGKRAQSLPESASLVSVVAPFFVGGWLGLGLRGFHFRAYGLTGASFGVMAYAILRVMGERPGAWWWYAVWGVTSFLAGAGIGDWIEIGLAPRRSASRYSRTLAWKLARVVNREGLPAERTINILELLIHLAMSALTLAGALASSRFLRVGAAS